MLEQLKNDLLRGIKPFAYLSMNGSPILTVGTLNTDVANIVIAGKGYRAIETSRSYKQDVKGILEELNAHMEEIKDKMRFDHFDFCYFDLYQMELNTLSVRSIIEVQHQFVIK